MAAKKEDFVAKKISPKLGGERGTRNPNGPTSSYDLVEQMVFLYVKPVKVINYRDANPIPYGYIPFVELTLGNYKSSTQYLPITPQYWTEDLVFAFDKSQGDVLKLTLNIFQPQTQENTNILIGKRDFKLAADIPSRVLPDASLAPQWYTFHHAEKGYGLNLNMSIWFGSQADKAYTDAWFSDASHVNASCVVNTRPRTYEAPRLSYVRLTFVSGHDLFTNDGKRTPSVYVKATLGKVCLKTNAASGSNPSWNQDLIFISSYPFDDIVEFELIDRVDDQHEECIGKLEKKVSEMTQLKVPGAAPALFYDINPPVKVSPAGDTRRFSSRIKMKLAIDQAYNVPEECSLYASDYRAFATGLWPGVIGKLEVGILGATNLTPVKECPTQRNAYVVAKYGNKWARTRTIVDNKSPKWNEQYSWDIYEQNTVITIGVYDNQQLVSGNQVPNKNDAPVGKVRIPLMELAWNKVYAQSFPMLNLGSTGVKKMGEIQLAVRITSNVPFILGYWPGSFGFLKAYFSWSLPKAHYKSPVSHYQMDAIRAQAVDLNCLNLARSEPPLRNEVVKDVLKPKSKSFSMRRCKAHYNRLYKVAMWLYYGYAWIDDNIRYQTDNLPKLGAGLFLLLVYLWPGWIWYLAFWPVCLYLLLKVLHEVFKLLMEKWNSLGQGVKSPPPLVLYDLKVSGLDLISIDELAEEFDSFPSAEADVYVLRMRYDRMRKMGEKVMVLMGDVASQGERLYALWMWCNDNPFNRMCFWSVCLLAVICAQYVVGFLYFGLVVYWLRFQFFVNSLPSGIVNYFRRLPTNERLML